VKIEQLIVQHLYKTKSVTLQGIGTIHLNPSVIIPSGHEKDFVMPQNAFAFEYNLKAPEEESLIEFIVQQTRKIRPLASSDLESYSILAKQFLNIGKPLVIPGIGTIQKNQEGIYEFIPGNFISAKIEDVPRQMAEKAEEAISFSHQSTKNNNKKYLIALLGILVLGLAGAALYYFLFYNKPAATEIIPEQAVQTTPPVDTAKVDTAAQIKTDSISIQAPPPVAVKTDSNNFTIVLKEYKNETIANQALARFSKYNKKFMVITQDSVTYQLALPFTNPIDDTARIRDSLRIFFGGKPFVLVQ
jgi:flagellar basal body-associated protein FliL